MPRLTTVKFQTILIEDCPTKEPVLLEVKYRRQLDKPGVFIVEGFSARLKNDKHLTIERAMHSDIHKLVAQVKEKIIKQYEDKNIKYNDYVKRTPLTLPHKELNYTYSSEDKFPWLSNATQERFKIGKNYKGEWVRFVTTNLEWVVIDNIDDYVLFDQAKQTEFIRQTTLLYENFREQRESLVTTYETLWNKTYEQIFNGLTYENNKDKPQEFDEVLRSYI